MFGSVGAVVDQAGVWKCWGLLWSRLVSGSGGYPLLRLMLMVCGGGLVTPAGVCSQLHGQFNRKEPSGTDMSVEWQINLEREMVEARFYH